MRGAKVTASGAAPVRRKAKDQRRRRILLKLETQREVRLLLPLP